MRMNFKKSTGVMMLGVLSIAVCGQVTKLPNVVFVLADEWRAQDVGFNGNKDVETPNLDRLAKRAVNPFG